MTKPLHLFANGRAPRRIRKLISIRIRTGLKLAGRPMVCQPLTVESIRHMAQEFAKTIQRIAAAFS